MARLLPNWRNGNCALPRAALMRAALACLLASAAVRAEEPPPEPHDGRDKDPDRFLWEGETGRGFRKGAWLGGAMTGTGFGMRRFGGKTRHDLVFFSAQAGRMMTGLVGEA
jgi:hypothetical protein